MSIPHIRRTIAPRFGSQPSPCDKTCQLDDDGFCVGCKRTANEIRNWTNMSDYEQKMLLADLLYRKQYG